MLEGSVRPVADALRVTVQRIASEDGTHVFAQRIDLAAAPTSDAQDELVADVAGALWVRVVAAERARSLTIPDDAARALARSVELEPDASYTRACYAWVQFVRIVNGWEEDITVLDGVADRHPAYAGVPLVKAVACEGIGDGESARHCVERAHATESDPHIPGIELQLRAPPNTEKADARVEMLRRCWPGER